MPSDSHCSSASMYYCQYKLKSKKAQKQGRPGKEATVDSDLGLTVSTSVLDTRSTEGIYAGLLKATINTNVGHCGGGLNRTRRICLLSPESHSPHATESQHRLACAPNSRRCHASLLPLKNHPCYDEDADNSGPFVETYVRRTAPLCGVLVSPVAKPRRRLSTQQPV